jgi:tripartite-type tricarboxylate transporter receptor subunit TctC
MFASLGSSWSHIDKGMLRPVAVGGTQRSSLMPNVPTIAESGIPGFSSYDWDAIFVPAGTPAPIVDKLSAAFAQALSAPKVQTTLKGIGADIIGSTPAELEKFLHEEISKWKDVAKKANLKLD